MRKVRPGAYLLQSMTATQVCTTYLGCTTRTTKSGEYSIVSLFLLVHIHADLHLHLDVDAAVRT